MLNTIVYFKSCFGTWILRHQCDMVIVSSHSHHADVDIVDSVHMCDLCVSYTQTILGSS